MGVDIETYRGRIGTFKFASGVDVIILQCTVNFTGCLKAVGSLAFIGILLVMAGIEQNPGPTEQGNRSAENDTVVIYSREDLNQPLYKNWVRTATGFKYFKSGLQNFIRRQIQEQHGEILRNIGPAATRCTSCTGDNLMPGHPTRRCLQKYRNKCFCKDHHGRRKCPSNFCSDFYDQVVISHAEANPLWLDVDTTRWYDNFFEFAKCFVSTTGYKEQHSVTEVDALGLLSIAINDLYIHDAIHDLDLFKKVRETRHEIFHTKSFEVTDGQLNQYIDEMIDALQDAKRLANDPDAQQAVKDLERLKAKQIYLSEEDASTARKIALEAINESKNEAINEIENARTSAIQEIDSRQEEKQIDEATRLSKRQELKRYIIEHYEKYYSTIDVSPLIRSKEIAIDELYTRLIIVRDNEEENPGYRKFTEIHSRFADFDDFTDDDEADYVEDLLEKTVRQKQAFVLNGNLLRNVFLNGEAGFGKTTVCKKILSLWCNFDKMEETGQPSQISVGLDWNLDLFKFVFYICLRNTNQGSSLEEMVKRQLLPSKYHETFEEILEHEPEKCLFICDGLDEWNPPEDMPKDPTTSPGLPLRKSKSKFVTLFTARSWKIDNIRPRTCEVDTMFTIKGIFRPDELIGKLLALLDKTSKKQSTINTFMHDVRTRKNIILLMKTPLVLKLIVCLWYDKQNLNESLTFVYSDIVELFLRHAEHRNSQDHKFQEEALKLKFQTKDMIPKVSVGRPYIQKYSTLIFKIAKLAFEALFPENKRTKLIFKPSEIFEYGMDESELNVLLKLGILSIHKVSSESVIEEEKEVAFIHKTFQEFFASWYMTSNENDQQRSMVLFRKYFVNTREIEQIEPFLVFVSCIDPPTIYRISALIAEMQDEETGRSEQVFFSKSYEAVTSVLFSCLRESTCANKNVRIKARHLEYNIRTNELLWNVDVEETKSLTIGCQILDWKGLSISRFEQLERLQVSVQNFPIQDTYQILNALQNSLKYVEIDNFSYQSLEGIRKLLQNMTQLQFIKLGNVLHLKSPSSMLLFLNNGGYYHRNIRFQGVTCMACSTNLQDEGHCNMIIWLTIKDYYKLSVTVTTSSDNVFKQNGCPGQFVVDNNVITIHSIKQLIPKFSKKIEFVDVKISLPALKFLIEKVIFRFNPENVIDEDEQLLCDMHLKPARCTLHLIEKGSKLFFKEMSISDISELGDTNVLLSILSTGYTIQDLQIANIDFKDQDLIIAEQTYQSLKSLRIWHVNMTLSSIRKLLSVSMNFTISEFSVETGQVSVRKRHAMGNYLTFQFIYTTFDLKFIDILHSCEVKQMLDIISSQRCISNLNLSNVILGGNHIDFDATTLNSLNLEAVSVTFETLIELLNRLVQTQVSNDKHIHLRFSEITVFQKSIVSNSLNIPEVHIEYCTKSLFKPTETLVQKGKLFIFKNVTIENIFQVNQILQLLNQCEYFSRRTVKPTSVIVLKNLKITSKTLKSFISNLETFGSQVVIEMSKVAVDETRSEENIIETCSKDWMPRFHVIDNNGMLNVFKEACMVCHLVCMTEENYNIFHLMRLLPTCHCLKELRLLDININSMTFNFNSEMKSLKRVYFSRIRATCASLLTLLERIPMSDQSVTVYLNNVFLLDNSPQVFLDTVLNMKQVHVEAFSKVKQVFPDQYFFFDDTEDDSQYFRMTARKQFTSICSQQTKDVVLTLYKRCTDVGH